MYLNTKNVRHIMELLYIFFIKEENSLQHVIYLCSFNNYNIQLFIFYIYNKHQMGKL